MRPWSPLLDLITDLTDQAIDLFERFVGTMFARWKGSMPGLSRPTAECHQ